MTITTAATYAYDQIDQARTELNAVSNRRDMRVSKLRLARATPNWRAAYETRLQLYTAALKSPGQNIIAPSPRSLHLRYSGSCTAACQLDTSTQHRIQQRAPLSKTVTFLH